MLRRKLTFFGATLLAFAITQPAAADFIPLKLTGNGGDGLLSSNIDPPPQNPGSGGIGPGGLFLDLDTNDLIIDIRWGSGNGFSDLSGIVTMLHLHGPTPSNAPNSFSERGPLLINLGISSNFDPSASDGGLQDTFFLSNTEVDYLLAGRTYFNVHTAQNSEFGEIRGYIIAIPEPTSGAFLAGLFVLCLRVRRRPKADKI